MTTPSPLLRVFSYPIVGHPFMPRAHRFFLPGYIYHITHRCHRREFLLKFARDRQCWLHWLYRARQRFGLCVLNYVVTSNHVHLLVEDQGRAEIARSLQLVGGCVAQQYNRRKKRRGAFWEDRYHATLVDLDTYLAACLTYIDLNMVRAGAVDHPQQWREGGYWELINPPQRYRITDTDRLMALLGLARQKQLQQLRSRWIDQAIETADLQRRLRWTDSVAVGSKRFIDQVRRDLGHAVMHRQANESDDGFTL